MEKCCVEPVTTSNSRRAVLGYQAVRDIWLVRSRRRLMHQDTSSRSTLWSELSSKLGMWKEHYEMFNLWALGRAGFVSLGMPISEDFFVLEWTR